MVSWSTESSLPDWLGSVRFLKASSGGLMRKICRRISEKGCMRHIEESWNFITIDIPLYTSSMPLEK